MRPWLSMSTTCKLTEQALQKRNYCQRFNFENFDDVPEALAQFDNKITTSHQGTCSKFLIFLRALLQKLVAEVWILQLYCISKNK